MKPVVWTIVSAMALAIALPGSPAVAGRLKPAGTAVSVARSPLTVTPGQAWTRGARPGRLAESWTLDGLTINEITFYGGIIDNGTLFREVDKTNRPLPRFSKTMLAPDIAQLFETSYRVALGTPLMTIDSIAPARFAGHDGFQFSYSFAVTDEVKRKGEARGAVIDGKLFLITYEAPRIHYFDRDVAEFRQIAEGARLAGAKKKK